jgi:hypothetical protein
MSNEANNQAIIRLEAARRGTPLLRNNVGACYDETGRLIRFGLGHDSAKTSRVFKSSDLIGIEPVIITQDMVGTVIGRFMAVEVKASNWTPRENDQRYTAQAAFGQWVIDHGGRFYFAKSIEDVWGLP